MATDRPEANRAASTRSFDAAGCGPFVLTRASAQAEPVQTQPSVTERLPSIQAQSDEELNTLNQEVIQLNKARKYDQALPIAEGALRLAKVLHGSEHPTIAVPVSSVFAQSH